MTYVKSVCLLLSISFCFTACNQATEAVEKERDQLRSELDSLRARNERLQEQLTATQAALESAENTAITPPAETPPVVEADIDHLIRPGQHAITLQWISWDHPGQVDIVYAGNGKYTVSGGQKSRDNDDYLRMAGTITPRSAREFVFDGTVEYQVSHNFGGKPCRKTGPLVFKASGTRKYWRMQDMTNCEGGMLTDYVDVYF